MKLELWQDWAILAVSGWLFFSPFVLGFATLSHPAAWVAFISALVLYVSAAEALVVPDSIEEWVDGGVGLALLASPWVLGFAGDFFARLNAVAAGLVVTALAAAALVRDRDFAAPGHHWAAKA